jgi:hypothetical protein
VPAVAIALDVNPPSIATLTATTPSAATETRTAAASQGRTPASPRLPMALDVAGAEIDDFTAAPAASPIAAVVASLAAIAASTRS